VEAVFAGPADVVAEMIGRCRQGPSSARVDRVDDLPSAPDALKPVRPGERFSQLPTG
jgi:acylphosphatase